jgi:phage-related tail protein
MAMGIIPGDLDSVAKAFANLKAKLEKGKVARETAKAEVDILTRSVKDLKISADKFVTQVTILEEKVKRLDNKVIDGSNKI